MRFTNKIYKYTYCITSYRACYLKKLYIYSKTSPSLKLFPGFSPNIRIYFKEYNNIKLLFGETLEYTYT